MKGQAQSSLVPLSQEMASKFSTRDTLFKAPYVDVDEWRDKPVRHRYVHGGFKNTGTRFSFYFPSKEGYQGRFFQLHTPFPDNENLAQNDNREDNIIGFSVASGAYFIETNGGGKTDFSKPSFGNDPTIGAYRANAAAAQFSRVVAMQLLGGKRPYGYAFGGSGGAYRTVGGIENTEGVWDGVVPIVMGSPMALPNVFTARMHAMRILKDKFPQIIDALEPGGSGDMYAGLNEEEKEALREVTKMGFPPQAWFAYKTMGIHGFVALYQAMTLMDAPYFKEDFWKKPGHLGANPPASLLKARLQQVSTIKSVIGIDQAVTLGLTEPMSPQDRGSIDQAWKSLGEKEGTMPAGYQLVNTLPEVGFLGGDLLIKSGAAKGKTLQLAKIAGDKVVLGPADASTLALIKPGDTVQVDNSNFLAAQTYHRHQVPLSRDEYPEWDQFRDAAGKPTYPQRPMLLGPLFTMGASGVVPTGKFTGKMIVLESLWDSEAFPWQADWYRNRVKANLGAKADDNFRLWYTDHANHADAQRFDQTKIVSYEGVFQQAMRDLTAWVEKGIAPPPSTSYKIEDGQVIVPAKASDRKGIQPVVSVKANGAERADVRQGQPVTFTAVADLPPNTGKIISAEWDFDGAGTFPVKGKIIPSGNTGSSVSLKTAYTFSKAGTYFPTLRVTSQRQGDAKTPFGRIINLGRVRVVVK
ncbi:hypothetical protein GCM10028808_55080 [Spirosoma migulaei]